MCSGVAVWMGRGQGWERNFRVKNIFEATTLDEVTQRLARLTPDSERRWGKMTVAQAMAHCTAAMETVFGKNHPSRLLLGRLLGPVAKRSLIGRGEPMRRNSMTEKTALVTDDRDFAVERERLVESLERFAAGRGAVCTKHPHFFFGPLTPEEWAVLVYQHLDHHLRQFGV
jgi:hypothetical protein